MNKQQKQHPQQASEANIRLHRLAIIFKQSGGSVVILALLAIACFIIATTFPKLVPSQVIVDSSTPFGYAKPLIALVLVGIAAGVLGMAIRQARYIAILSAVILIVIPSIAGFSGLTFIGASLMALYLWIAHRSMLREERARKVIEILPITRQGVRSVVFAFVVFSTLLYYRNVAVPRVSQGIVVPPSVFRALQIPLQFATHSLMPDVSLDESVHKFKEELFEEQIAREVQSTGELPQEMQALLRQFGYAPTQEEFTRAFEHDASFRKTLLEEAEVELSDDRQENETTERENAFESFIRYIVNEDPQKTLFESITDASNQHLISALERYRSAIPVFVAMIFFILVQTVSRATNLVCVPFILLIFQLLKATGFLSITTKNEPVESIFLERSP